MTITHQTVIDSHGTPAWALVPWQDFVRIQALLEGDEVPDDEAAFLREAEADRRSGGRNTSTGPDSYDAERSR